MSDLLRPNGKKATDLPNYQGKPICLMFHCNGQRNQADKCTFVHDNPRDLGISAVMDAFYDKRYNKNG
jgi:hypothetical protein